MCTGWASASGVFWAACSTRDESGELLGSESRNGGEDGGFSVCALSQFPTHLCELGFRPLHAASHSSGTTLKRQLQTPKLIPSQ